MVSVERVALGYNNVYLVSEGETLVVIDTGPDYRGARETLTAELAGRKPDLVVATHGHLDHAGLGAWWQEEGVPVALGAEDRPQANGSGDGDLALLGEFVRAIGAPRLVQAEVTPGLEARVRYQRELRSARDWAPARDRRWASALRYEAFEPKRLLEGTGALPCGLELLTCPGHTPGNCVLIQRDEGWLFSGDQLLPEITPTPAIQFSGGKRFPSLPRFLDSLSLLSTEFEGDRCFPGHGEPFEGVHEVVEANLQQAEQRGARVLAELTLRGVASTYDLAEAMYPRALARRFWQIVSTVQGQLDVLEETGVVTSTEGGYLPA